MQFNKISPQPKSSIATASSYAPMSRPSRPPFTVHWNHTYSSPFGPGLEVLTHLFLVSAGSFTYCRRGSMLTTIACTPYRVLICSMLVLPSFALSAA